MIALAVALSLTAPAQAAIACDLGPVAAQFGGTGWIAYGCEDGSSIVLVAAPDNPAGPFQFILRADGTGYAISGKGSGDRAASTAAGDEISALTRDQIDSLYAATRAAGRVQR